MPISNKREPGIRFLWEILGIVPINTDNNSAQQEAEADATPALVIPEADATPALVTPQTEADATPALVIPEAEADATPALVTPQAEANATPALVTPQAEADATPALVTPQAKVHHISDYDKAYQALIDIKAKLGSDDVKKCIDKLISQIQILKRYGTVSENKLTHVLKLTLDRINNPSDEAKKNTYLEEAKKIKNSDSVGLKILGSIMIILAAAIATAAITAIVLIAPPLLPLSAATIVSAGVLGASLYSIFGGRFINEGSQIDNLSKSMSALNNCSN